MSVASILPPDTSQEMKIPVRHWDFQAGLRQRPQSKRMHGRERGRHGREEGSAESCFCLIFHGFRSDQSLGGALSFSSTPSPQLMSVLDAIYGKTAKSLLSIAVMCFFSIRSSLLISESLFFTVLSLGQQNRECL